jgi:hypothetical protein
MTTITITQTFTSKTRNGGGGGAIPPSNTVAPVISGTPTVGQTLSCSTGTWLGTLPITYTYQWRRGVSNILGATSSTYTLVQADASFAVTCIVTATNAAGSADSTSNSLTIFDADAQAFITAAGITDNTQKTAINTLVVDMKGFGIWTKMKAIYPFVGGTATTHKFNLKNPLDTNAAFRLVFNGGWTHSATGALPNGTNGYANTFLNPNAILSLSNSHISYYSRTLAVGAQIEMGVFSADVPDKIIQIRLAVNYVAGSVSSFISFTTTTDARGFWLGTKRANNDRESYRNGITQASSTINDATAYANIPIYIAARNNQNVSFDFPTSKECAFASIGDGLTDTEAANFYTAVQNFNTTLTRNV